MNSNQRDQIEFILDNRLKDEPLAREIIEAKRRQDQEPFIVKNLENVQGDERDVIFISITYGPLEVGGRVLQHFGPINHEAGWRRLNVLFTRSKKRIHVFSSIRSFDILISPSSSRGVRVFREYLNFAETGHLIQSIETGRPPDSHFEVDVANALLDRGYECVYQVGVAGYFIDLAVKDPENPGRYILGVECDGATYHSAKAARDRDCLRQMILEQLGWKLHRIWSTDWFKDSGRQVNLLVNTLDTLREKKSINIA